MQPTNFPQSNKALLKPETMTDEQCVTLHVYNDGTHNISLWRGDWKDRLRFLFTGKMWLWVVSGRTQPPVALQTDNPFYHREPLQTKDSQQCEHGVGLMDYCQPCGRIHGGG